MTKDTDPGLRQDTTSIILDQLHPGIIAEQTSTRGDGYIELTEPPFSSDTIDFSRVVDHLKIHTDGDIAGSQFNGEHFKNPDDIVDFVKGILPEAIRYDQHDMAEITLACEDALVGYYGIGSVAELREMEDATLERVVRTPGGEPAVEDGVKGAWFPEITKNPDTGAYETARSSDGSIKNPRGKFEPEAWVASVDKETALDVMATNKVTVIIQKDPETSLPIVRTAFPGENAPPQPSKITTEAYQADTLGGPEAAYWEEHAFIKPV